MKVQVTVETRQAEELGEKVTLRRGVCVCGWRGCWYQLPGSLEQSVRKHLTWCGLLFTSNATRENSDGTV